MENERLNYGQVAPDGIKGLLEIEKYVANSGLDMTIFELVKMRASQINGCAYCLDMHSKDARAAGEKELRLYVLNAWREAPFYTEKERAALAWTEALTLISENEISDALYKEVSTQFDEQELMALTMTIVGINGWNRLAIAFRTKVGMYKAEKS